MSQSYIFRNASIPGIYITVDPVLQGSYSLIAIPIPVMNFKLYSLIPQEGILSYSIHVVVIFGNIMSTVS